MKILLVILLVVFSLDSFAGAKEVNDEWNSLKRQYSTGGCPPALLDQFYRSYFSWLDSLNPVATIEQVLQMAERLSRLQIGNPENREEFIRQFRDGQQERIAMRRGQSRVAPSMRRPLPSVLPIRSIFDEPVSANQMWDRISMDLTETNAKETKLALRTVLQFLADTDARSRIAAGETLDLSIAGQNLYKWLRGFGKGQLTKTADSYEKDKLQLRLFAVRWHALMRLARARQLFELVEQLDSMRRLIDENPLTQAKGIAANRIGSMAPSEACFEPNESYQNSRAQSVLSQFSYATANSHREARSIAPRRSDYEFDVVDNSGGGDCLFLALGTTRGDFIRQVTTNLTAIEDLLIQAMAVGEVVDLDHWLNLMLNGGYEGWGGHFELALFAQLNNVRIVIFQPDETGAWETVYQDGPATANQTVFLGRTTVLGGEHYVRLNPRRQMTEDELVLVKKFQKNRVNQKMDEEIRQEIIELFSNPEALFDMAPNLMNAQAVIAALNASGETINKTLRDKLLAAGFKVTGSKGKYVITQIEQASRKNGRDDRDPPPPPSGGAAGGASGGDTAETEQPVSKKSRNEAVPKAAPKASYKGHARNVLLMAIPTFLCGYVSRVSP